MTINSQYKIKSPIEAAKYSRNPSCHVITDTTIDEDEWD